MRDVSELKTQTMTSVFGTSHQNKKSTELVGGWGKEKCQE